MLASPHHRRIQKVYEAYKYELTEDFSDRRDAQEQAERTESHAEGGGSGSGVGMMESGMRDSRGHLVHHEQHRHSVLHSEPASSRDSAVSNINNDLSEGLLERRESGTVVKRKD